jgi:hypothetical protein
MKTGEKTSSDTKTRSKYFFSIIYFHPKSHPLFFVHSIKRANEIYNNKALYFVSSARPKKTPDRSAYLMPFFVL